MNNRVRKRKSRQPRIFKFGFGLILVVIVVLIGLLAYEKIHSSVPSGKVTSLNAVKHDKTSSWVSTWALRLLIWEIINILGPSEICS